MNNDKFEILYDTYYNSVYKYIYISLKDKYNAEDVISSVFMKLYENKDKLADVENCKNLVFKIAHNAIIDFYRKNSKVIPIDNFIDSGSDDTNYEVILIRDEFEKVKRFIDQLPEETRNMVYMRFYGGLKFREIADSLSKTESTVKVTVMRAIKKIKKDYEKNMGKSHNLHIVS